MHRDDWLLRQFDQVAAVISRVAGLRQGEQFESAREEAERGWDGLGVRRDVALMIDVRTLAEMLRTPEAMKAAIDLLVEEAELEAARGNDGAATARRHRADELRRIYLMYRQR